MNKATQIEARIGRYVEEVRAHLGDLTEEEIEEILSSIRSHIEGELHSRSEGQPTLEMVEALLQEMDSPESYGEGIGLLAADELVKRRFSRPPIIGTVLLPFGVVMALMFFMVSGTSTSTAGSSSTTAWQWVARFTVLPLGILAPFACTALGLMGVSEIRKSKGNVVGMPLAVFVGLFYPIIVLDAVLFVLTLWLFGDESYWNVAVLAVVLLMLVIDFFIIRATWRAAIKPRPIG
jgi:uncharacterized membrane protein YqjE